MILNRVKNYLKYDKERLREQARDKYRDSLKKKKMKSENMEETDIIICLKKRNKIWKNIKKNLREAKKLKKIIIELFFFS